MRRSRSLKAYGCGVAALLLMVVSVLSWSFGFSRGLAAQISTVKEPSRRPPPPLPSQHYEVAVANETYPSSSLCPAVSGSICGRAGACERVTAGDGLWQYSRCSCNDGHAGRDCGIPLSTLLGASAFQDYKSKVAADSIVAPGDDIKPSAVDENQHVTPAQVHSLLRSVVPLPFVLTSGLAAPSAADLQVASDDRLFRLCDAEVTNGANRAARALDEEVVASHMGSCAWLALKRVVSIVASLHDHYPVEKGVSSGVVVPVALLEGGVIPTTCLDGGLLGLLGSGCVPRGWREALIGTRKLALLEGAVVVGAAQGSALDPKLPTAFEVLSSLSVVGWNAVQEAATQRPFTFVLNPLLVARIHEHTNLQLAVSQLLLPGAVDVIGFNELLPINSESFSFHAPTYEIRLRRWSMELARAAFGYQRHTSYTIISDTTSFGAVLVRSGITRWKPTLGPLSLLGWFAEIHHSNSNLPPLQGLPGVSVHPAFTAVGTCAECLLVYSDAASRPWGLGLLGTTSFADGEGQQCGDLLGVRPVGFLYLNAPFAAEYGVEVVSLRNSLAGSGTSTRAFLPAARNHTTVGGLITALLGGGDPSYWLGKDGAANKAARRQPAWGGVAVACAVSGGMYGPSKQGLYAPFCHRALRMATFHILHGLWTQPALLGGERSRTACAYMLSVHAGNLFGALRFNKELLWETDGDLNLVALKASHTELIERFNRLLTALEGYRYPGSSEPIFTVRRSSDGKPWYASVLLGNKVDIQLNARSAADPLTRGKPPHHHNVTILYNGVRVGINGFQNPWQGVRSAPGHEYGRLYLSMQKWTTQRRSSKALHCKATGGVLARWCLPDCNSMRSKADHNYCSADEVDEVV